MTSGSLHKELIRLNLGCGLTAPPEWINIDASFTARLSKCRGLYSAVCKIVRLNPIEWPENIKILDVRKGLPFVNGTVVAIFSSHLLEHMNFEDADFVIKECYRCLCKGGVIRIIVPDLFQMAKRYIDFVSSDQKGEHSKKFLQDLKMQDRSDTRFRKLILTIFGHSKHLYMYDQWSLRELLQQNRFTHIEKMQYAQSRIPNIELVEDKSRHEMAVCLEAIKKG